MNSSAERLQQLENIERDISNALQSAGKIYPTSEVLL